MRFSIASLGMMLLVGNLSYGVVINTPDNSNRTRTIAASTISRADYDIWFQAAEAGDIGQMQSLIDRGINVNYQNWIGYTALMCAAGEENIPAMKFLLDNNAILDGALAFATRKGREESAKFLLANGSRATEKWAISAAVVSGNINVVRLLLENGANPNGDGYWNAPLIIAAEGHDWDIFRLLLKYNADPQVRNRRGYTVFDFARATQCYGIVGGIIQDMQHRQENN